MLEKDSTFNIVEEGLAKLLSAASSVMLQSSLIHRPLVVVDLLHDLHHHYHFICGDTTIHII